ncbi:MAG: PQQ-binding-like beta-propeller repeat protein [Verrucomicrobiota bacterium]|nr:PQQ-binding-like beta-propeller repeat protein [Verrucomicrobiota bacterium]|tara:strand:+ start:1870 stop:3120 length:1251 start_codon:yes stop_codon:yes gene_type:complete
MKGCILLLITVASCVVIEANEQWSQFRGHYGNGIIKSTSAPINWSENTNIDWKTPIHDRGWSSPVIWNDQIWMTTATKDGNKMYAICVNKLSGKIEHDIHVFDVKSPQAITNENTYASPTPVVEEGRVYVHFGTYGTACISTKDGQILWKRRDLNCDHEIGAGPASSPFIYNNFLIFNVDGRDVQYVIALNKETGETAWKTNRSVDFSDVQVNQRKAYGTPFIIPRGNTNQMVSIGAKGVYSYDPENGKELWKAEHRGWSIAPRPVYGEGLVFTMIDRDRPEMWAINPNGSGDITETHIQWKETKRMPPRASPIIIKGLLFVVDRNGYISCIEAKTGKSIWQKRMKGRFSASPILANNLIYFFNEDTVCTIIKPTRELEIVAENKLSDDKLMATPAFDENSIYIRTEKKLTRIVKK